MKMINLTGKKFGRLLVIKQEGTMSNGKGSIKSWLCKCDCGKKIIVRGRCLTSKNTKSCGCYSREVLSKRRKTHGMSNTKLYRLWADIRKRCSKKASKRHKKFYKNISVCKEWENFQSFYDWAKPKWKKGLDIDRKNTLLGYSPDNCHFTTRKINAQNKKNSKEWHIKGKIFDSSQDAAKYFNCSQSHIYFMCHGRKTKTKYYPPHKNCHAIKKYTKDII